MNSSKQKRRAQRRTFENAGVILLKRLIPLLSRRTLTRVSHFAARTAMLLPLREKKIGMKNLDAVFGNTRSTAEKKAILTSSFYTFSLTMMDVFWFAKNPEERLNKYVSFAPECTPLLTPQAHIFITAHFGSWEVMGQATALQGIDLASIAATIKNPYVDQLLRQSRERTGQTIIPQKGALRSLIARLRKKGKVAFVLDQHTSEREGGIPVDFLGIPMLVSAAPAALAYRTGTEIVCVFCTPQPDGHYLIRVPNTLRPPLYDKSRDSDEVARELTEQIIDIISAEIRKHPEYWLWSYKHWRREGKVNDFDRYPDY